MKYGCFLYFVLYPLTYLNKNEEILVNSGSGEWTYGCIGCCIGCIHCHGEPRGAQGATTVSQASAFCSWKFAVGIFHLVYSINVFLVLPWQNNIFTLQKLFLSVPLFPDLILNLAQVAVPKVCCLKIVCPQIWWFILNCPFQHAIWWI